MCACLEHHQREDLHHAVVLVRRLSHLDRLLHRLHRGSDLDAEPQEKPRYEEGQRQQQGPGLPPRGQGRHRRLVHAIPRVQEHGPQHLQHLHRGDH